MRVRARGLTRGSATLVSVCRLGLTKRGGVFRVKK